MKKIFAIMTLSGLLFFGCSNNSQKPEDAHSHEDGSHTHDDGTSHGDHEHVDHAQEEFTVTKDSASKSKADSTQDHGHDHDHDHGHQH